MAVEVDSQRLRKLKCPICGSTDKNTAEINMPGDASSSAVLKIMNCNRCGYTWVFGLSALAVADLLLGSPLKTPGEYETILRQQHPSNHTAGKNT